MVSGLVCRACARLETFDSVLGAFNVEVESD